MTPPALKPQAGSPRIQQRLRCNPATGRKERYYSAVWTDLAGRSCSRAFGFIELGEVGFHLAALSADIVAGRARRPRPNRPSDLARLTLREFLEEDYLPHRAMSVRATTHSGDRTRVAALIRTMGDVSLRRVGTAQVQAHDQTRRAEGCADVTVYNELSTLRCALRLATTLGLIRSLPVIDARMFERRPQPWLTADESVALLRVLKEGGGSRRSADLHLAVMMGLNTGMRPGEVLTRSWDDVQWSAHTHGVLRVDSKPEFHFNTKSGRARAVPITPELRLVLRQHHRRQARPARGWIFPGRSPEGRRKHFPSSLANACRRAGVPEITPHALRRSWASRLALACVDRRTIMEVAGWTEGAMLDLIYSQVTDEHVTEVMGGSGIGPS